MPLTPPDPLAAAAAQVRRLQRLLDVYGPLLTDHQREACRLRLDDDWSYTELAEAFGCTRSGAYDLVRRALAQLEHFEERLGHAAELARRDAIEAELRFRLRLRAGVASAAPAPAAEGHAGSTGTAGGDAVGRRDDRAPAPAGRRSGGGEGQEAG